MDHIGVTEHPGRRQEGARIKLLDGAVGQAGLIEPSEVELSCLKTGIRDIAKGPVLGGDVGAEQFYNVGRDFWDLTLAYGDGKEEHKEGGRHGFTLAHYGRLCGDVAL